MKYQGVIFDLDGVLCTTDRFHFQAWQQTAREVDAPFDETVNQRLRGVSRMESLEIILEGSPRTLSPQEKHRLAEEKNDRYRTLLSQLTPRDMEDGVRRTLRALRAAGLKLAVGSSSKNAGYILQQLQAEDLFDAVCDGTQITHSKPDPEVFLRAAQLLGLPPKDCLVVEDAPAGLEAAQAGGMDCAVIGDAGMPFPPAYHLNRLDELPGLIL